MVRIRLNNLHVNEISNSSGISYGKHNIQVNRAHHSKTKEGFGSISGDDNDVQDCIHIVVSSAPPRTKPADDQ